MMETRGLLHVTRATRAHSDVVLKKQPVEARQGAGMGVREIDDDRIEGNTGHCRQFLPKPAGLGPGRADHIDRQPQSSRAFGIFEYDHLSHEWTFSPGENRGPRPSMGSPRGDVESI